MCLMLFPIKNFHFPSSFYDSEFLSGCSGNSTIFATWSSHDTWQDATINWTQQAYCSLYKSSSSAATHSQLIQIHESIDPEKAHWQ